MKQIVILALCIALASASLLDVRQAAEITFNNLQAVQVKLGLKDEVDYTFDYTLTGNSKTGVDFAPFLFGTNGDTSSEGNPVKLHVSTMLKNVALPGGSLSAATDGWGIKCETKNNCIPSADAFDNKNCGELENYKIYDSGNTAYDFWTATKNQCKAATTFIRWTNSTLDNATDYKTYLPVTLFQTAPAVDVKVGTMGIAPNSDFMNYIKDHTDALGDKGTIQFGLSMTPNSGASKLVDTATADSWKQNQFVIKGKRNGGDIPFMSSVVKGASETTPSSWTIGMANFTLAADEKSSYTPKENQVICVSSEYPWMAGFADKTASDALIAYFSTVCPNGAANCAEDGASKDKIKSVTFGLSNQDLSGTTTADLKTYKLTVDTNDILWFSKPATGNPTMTPIIGQNTASADMTKYGCPATANIIVGKPFLSKYEAVMRVGKSTYELGFIANEGTSSIFLIILIILGCIILAICIAIILLKVCKRKSNEEAEYTRQE